MSSLALSAFGFAARTEDSLGIRRSAQWPAQQTRRHPEELGAFRAERLEGWPQAPRLLPSFETGARKCARPPQDDV
jgi:hypothetical protein